MMEGRELTDRYRLEKILASSPGTTVMAAVEAASGRPVVMKLVHPRSAASLDVARSRFAHWTATVRALSHPVFPLVLEAGFNPEGSAYLVTERLAGRSFAAADLPAARAAAHLAAVEEALALLAKRGLAHGNLAAENLWLAPAPGGAGEQVKLLGLGTAPFREGEFGEAAIAADAASLAALRETFAPAAAVEAESRRQAALGEAAGVEEAPEVLTPVSEEALHPPPEPAPPPAPAAEEPPPAPPEPAPRRPALLVGGLAAAVALVVLAGVVVLARGRDESPASNAAGATASAAAAAAPRLPRPTDLVLAGDDAHVRDWAAARLETRAEESARAGDYAAALATLATLERGWPQRAGLAARLAALRAQRDAEPVQQAFLQTLPGFERRRKPADGLVELARFEPTPHLAPAFADARRRLEEQLAGLDREAPAVELREGYQLEYDRGTVAELSFRARDDYAVERVQIFARPAGSSFHELPHARSSFGYSVEIGPDFHRNGTVELFVVATDLSGHEGRLGSRERPLLLRRTQGFGRMLGD